MSSGSIKLGDFEGAVRFLEPWCLAHPQNVEFRYLLADALAGARNPEGAAAVLKGLAGDHPKHALRALRRLRSLHVDAGRWEDALDVQKRIATRFAAAMNQAERAQGAAFLYQVGMAKVEADQFKEAATVFQQVLKDDRSLLLLASKYRRL